jgi:hypothetical protein
MYQYWVRKIVFLTSANMLFSVRCEVFVLYFQNRLGKITFHFYLLDHYKSLIKLSKMETHPVKLDPSESVRAHYIVKQYQNTLFILTY